jgi:hypothetical protein
MNENDRWGAHLEYFKLSIALTTALVAAAAAIYVDVSKIPADNSRYLLLAGVGVFSITLICSVWGLAALGNHLLHVPPLGTTTPTATQSADMNRRSLWVVRWGNASFVTLVIAAVLLGSFFALRTFQIGQTSYERAIATASIANGGLVNASKGETATLKSLDLQGNNYQLTFQISPGPGTTTIVTDSTGTKLTSAHRQ